MTVRAAAVATAVAGSLVAVLGFAAGARPESAGSSIETQRACARVALQQALAVRNITAARRAWQAMYLLALDGHDWRELVEVADTQQLIVRRTGFSSGEGTPRPSELYLAALFRARAQRSVEGALKVAESLAALGNREAAALALRLAATMPPAPPAELRPPAD